MAVAQEGSFGAQLRNLREAAGLTQEELALKAGLSPTAVSALERGQRKRPYRRRIAAWMPTALPGPPSADSPGDHHPAPVAAARVGPSGP